MRTIGRVRREVAARAATCAGYVDYAWRSMLIVLIRPERTSTSPGLASWRSALQASPNAAPEASFFSATPP